MNTVSNWASMSSEESSWDMVTATVFCAVTAVTTDAPKAPLAEIARRSAWIPAPPPESDPAMVTTTFTILTYAGLADVGFGHPPGPLSGRERGEDCI